MAPATETAPIWLRNFLKYNGVKELKGAKHSPEIMALLDWADGHYDQRNLQGIKDDETPYCSSALCGGMEQVGIVSPRSAWARDWLKWGDILGGPAVGAIVVFERGSGGHVGLVVGRDNAGNLVVYGANQGDMFKHSAFPITRVLGYRWPKGFDKQTKIGFPKLPITSASPTRGEV